ncbi:MAG: asparagine--tRNA ligase [Pseudomonadota bacterium]|nr:asparagine--tRNA ligase [Halieaceae bacterium]MEC7492044.1 asparagine--tRNA ligase [Pseudomonadota bacterium]MEC7992698.1 asparagine--tRNA ligase [Pseudomonadota bacterium]MEC8001285.1 asparagine--tRNA ligase [Pseudomonadota bacterium]MEC8007661.1 asparagine--tRNA ligase [Pseudomonadota bacterium]|tara:strand:- start:112 stop:1509 length:1398 start_codon:yes stop_codon:yes gene_type:complete
MSQTHSVKNLLGDEALIGSHVTVQGWLRSKRDSKAGISFLAVNDGSHFDSLQCVAPKELENYEDEVLKLSTGCAVIVSGELVPSQGGGQSVEIQASHVELIGGIDDPESYPIAKKRHTFEYLRTQAHLRTRTNTFGAVTRVRHTLANAIHDFFHSEDFYWVNTPIITASDCEGAGELFRVSTLDLTKLPRDDKGQVDTSQDFFGSDAYLTVSGQLAVESYCLSMSKVYTFGPTFRAENSNTSRHLAEFWMVEPEVAFADLADNAALAERLLKSVTQRVLNDCENDLGFFQQRIDNTVLERLTNIVDQPFVRVTYSDAIDILLKSGKKFEFPVEWGIDMASEHERFLSETHFKAPVVVTDYPRDIKAFYMRLNDDERTVAAMDVLAPGIGEIIGGSQREERLDVLDARMDEALKDTLWWYRDLRRYGTVPHAGFGLGFERLVAYITGMENVRDVIPFPRTPGNAEF